MPKLNESRADPATFANTVHAYVFENNVSRVKEVRRRGGGCSLVGESITVGIAPTAGMGSGESLAASASMSRHVR